MCDEQHESEIIEETGSAGYGTCLNCGTELNGEYCHVCGQQANNGNRTVKSFVMEYINNAFIWDSQQLKTIWLLVRKPGFLTTEFISGRYVSYVHPLKLNMFMLFVFITAFVFFSTHEKLNHSVSDFVNDERVFPALQVETLQEDSVYVAKMKECPRDTVQLYAPLLLAEEYPGVMTCLDVEVDTKGESLDKWTAVVPAVLVEDKYIIPGDDGYYVFNRNAGEGDSDIMLVKTIWEQLVALLTRYFPMIVLLTAPFLSFSLRLLQRKNKLSHIDRFIFSLHYTAFLELLILFIYFVYLIAAPVVGVLQWILIAGSCVYLTMAFHHVYKMDSWVRAAIKSLLVSMIYAIIIFILLVCNFFVSCIMVGYQYVHG